ncbi:hypothetical protein [Coraliomargarita parva]|uniref:hypothetical protein n=1 Tax=Coraliomargarita parva TaxID=3014050 RepID=UPI0022B3B0D2|nr:hypothetical protein [Coraliomargarita parva]
MKLFVKGDLDGFFALGLDNMVMLMLMSSLCQGFLGFSNELFYAQILPATAVGLAIGNFYYARQALKLAKRENRDDVCAIPYGASILTIVAFVFLAMYPVQQAALAEGATKADADRLAWQAGLLACFCSGLIEFFGAFVVYHIRRFTPRAALLSTLAGIGFTFIAMDFVFRSFAYPLVGITMLGLTLLVYFGGVKLKWGLPVGMMVIVIGSVLSWTLHFTQGSNIVPAAPLQPEMFGLYLPIPVLGDLFAAFKMLPQLLPVLAPVGIIHLVLSLQNIESAAAAGDNYPAKPALAVNGLGTIAAAVCGSPFPTSIYIGHPGWKALGARAGYSVLTGSVLGIICLTGSASLLFHFVPIEAGMAILIWIGISMMSQAFEATPQKHIPAVIIGIIPPVGAYIALMLKHAVSAAGIQAGTSFFEPGLLGVLQSARSFYAHGAFALEQGYVYSSVILAAATVCIIDQQFRKAAAWFLLAAFFSMIGLLHQYSFTYADTVSVMRLELNEWFWAYLTVAALLWIAPWITVKSSHGHH